MPELTAFALRPKFMLKKAKLAKVSDAKPRVLASSATLAATKDPKIAGLPRPRIRLIEEVLAMRDSLLLLTLFLTACGSSSDGPKVAPQPFQHVPEISSLTISPDSAAFMDGDGSVIVTAEINFSDAGRDIKTLCIRMPDGITIEFDQATDLETGMLTEVFSMPTDESGTFLVEIWLEDKAGHSSAHRVVDFRVNEFVWTSRVSGLPYVLRDVVWSGNVFIAVGERGAILTSADGISWIEKESGTDADLSAVAADGSNVVAVGFKPATGVILQSTDHGVSWSVKERPPEAVLQAVAINSSQIVVGGNRWGWGTAIAMISEDRGETWRAVDSWPAEELTITDLVYGDGMFIAATNGLNRGGEAWVVVSADGNLWNEIAVNDEQNFLTTIFHDDGQFFLAGGSWSEPFAEYLGTVYTSMDGFNWTQLQTPVEDVFYQDMASNGTRLVVAGSATCGYLGGKCFEQFDVPIGLASTDGGLTWDVFNIDGDYESLGLAWGNGRFVSVGEKPRLVGDGAIYTAD
jgi:hypothetical protein